MTVFTAIHVALSLIGIVSGFVVLSGFLYGRALRVFPTSLADPKPA